MSQPGLLAVAAREVAWIRREPAMLVLLFGVPLLAFAILTAAFSNPVIRDLRITVIDADRSQASADFVQALDSTPGLLVDRRSTDLSDAMHAIRAGEAIAAVYLPENLERDILAGQRPQVEVFYNRQFLTPGNLASLAAQSAIAGAAAELPRLAGSAGYRPGSLVVERYVLSNPALNYAQFLLRAALPTVLHVVIAVAGAAAVGSEFGRSRGVGRWMQAAGGRPMTALIGKFAPYFAVFALMMSLAILLLHGLLGVPFAGDPVLTASAGILFVTGYFAMGAMLVLLVRNLALGLALVGVICSPAFGFAGVGFPLLAAGGFARVWGAVLPLRWYIQILFDQALRGAAPRLSLPAFLALALLALSFATLAWLLLRRAAKAPPARPAPLPDPLPRPGVAGAFAAEYSRVLRDSGAFGLIVLGPLIYAVLYPQPYLGQLLRDIPVAVVDEDNTEVSRALVQAIDAHEGLAVAARPTSLVAGREAIAAREIYAVLGIPAGTERDVLAGRPARIPAYVDAAYFLIYSRASQGFSEAAGAVNADIATGAARPEGSLARAALSRASPVEFLAQPLYNPTGAYGSYVVPAALILILQQSLLMGVATLGGVAHEGGGPAARRARTTPVAVAGHTLAHLALALPSYALYLVVLPRVYGFASSPRLLDLLVLAVPFILAVSLLGQVFGGMFRRRETAVALLLALGLPLFFLAGVAWPPEALPAGLRTVAGLVPSSVGIDAFLRLNQTGASFAEVRQSWLHLWALVAVYGALAVLLPRLRPA